jgi:hypothetical protein
LNFGSDGSTFTVGRRGLSPSLTVPWDCRGARTDGARLLNPMGEGKRDVTGMVDVGEAPTALIIARREEIGGAWCR